MDNPVVKFIVWFAISNFIITFSIKMLSLYIVSKEDKIRDLEEEIRKLKKKKKKRD